MPSRSLEQGSTQPISYKRKVWSPAGVLIEDSDDVVNIFMNHFEFGKQWVRTPNFWQLRRTRANLPDNDFLYGSLRREQGTFDYEWTRTAPSGNREWRKISVPTQWWNLTPEPPDMPIFDLLVGLAGQARQSNFSLPITLIEGRRTATMIMNTATTLAGAIHDVRRGNLTGMLSRFGLGTTSSQRSRFNRSYGRDPSRAAADAWLQYQYGWKPLLNDAKNAAEALAEAVSRNGDDSTTSVRKRISDNLLVVTHGAVIGSSPFTTGTVITRCQRSRRAIWRFKPRAADLPGLFGMVNPAEVVWEVIPFSFVADWFLPIGNYLSTLDLPLRFTHVGGSTGYRKVSTWTTIPKSVQHKDGQICPNVGDLASTAQSVMVRRDKLGGPPVPSVNDMYFRPQLGASRVTSAIALLRQQASRLGR